MKRTTQLKRTRLNRISPKTAARQRADAKRRAEYLRQHSYCFLAYFVRGMNVRASEIHHLCGRDARRPDVFERPENWLPISRRWHDAITADQKFYAKQCAKAKELCTPEDYDPAYLEKLKPRLFGFLIAKASEQK